MEQNSSNGDTVVPLQRPGSERRFAVLDGLRAYWEGLRAGRAVPLRSEVDPRGIEPALEFAFILERVAPSVARFRLSGMHLSDLMGMEVRGMPLTALFTPRARARMAALVEAVFQEPQAADLTLAAESGIGRPRLAARMLILPLRSDLGDVSRALGCLVSEGETGRTPRRFDVIRAEVTTLVATPAPLPGPAPALVAGLAEPGAPFRPGPGRPRPLSGRRPNLRLVGSD